MKVGQYLISCKIKGRFYDVDILDLEEESFRAFMLDRLAIARVLMGLKNLEMLKMDEKEIQYKVKADCENKYIKTDEETRTD